MTRRLSWLMSLAVATAIALSPSESFAKGFGRGGGRSGSRGSAPSAPTRHYASPNGRNTYYFQGNGPRAYRPGYGGEGYRGGYRWGAGRPYWGYYGGWGIYPWGYYAYGYYPYWGAPPLEQAPEGNQRPKTDSFTLFGGGGMTSQGFTPSGSFSYDGLRWGVNFQGIGLISVPTNTNDSSVYMPLLSAHLAFSLVSTPHLRWRIEGGASSVFTPAATYLGPDFGSSVQLAIAGPFGIQAAAHYTPVPAKILDVEANVTLSFGGLGVKGGWRVIRLDDRDVRGAGTGGLDIFSGPMVSLGIMY